MAPNVLELLDAYIKSSATVLREHLTSWLKRMCDLKKTMEEAEWNGALLKMNQGHVEKPTSTHALQRSQRQEPLLLPPPRGLRALQEPGGDSVCFITCLWFGRDRSKLARSGQQSQARGGKDELHRVRALEEEAWSREGANVNFLSYRFAKS